MSLMMLFNLWDSVSLEYYDNNTISQRIFLVKIKWNNTYRILCFLNNVGTQWVLILTIINIENKLLLLLLKFHYLLPSKNLESFHCWNIYVSLTWRNYFQFYAMIEVSSFYKKNKGNSEKSRSFSKVNQLINPGATARTHNSCFWVACLTLHKVVLTV